MSDQIVLIPQVIDGPALKLFADAGSHIREQLRVAMARVGDQISGAAAAAAPHKTGALAGSIHAHMRETLDSLTEVVKADEFYGLFLEHGVVAHDTAHNRREKGGKRIRQFHRQLLAEAGMWRIAPRPFLRPAVDSLRDQILAELRDAVAEGAAQAEAA